MVKDGESFEKKKSKRQVADIASYSKVPYDLISKIVNETSLTRLTVANILSGLNSHVFNYFKQNPEEFIIKAINIINEQKSSGIVEHLEYNLATEKYKVDIFTQNNERIYPDATKRKLTKHIYDYANFDSLVESKFAEDLEISEDVVVYSKLPRGYLIPTPVGNYNPDWAIVFKEGTVKHIYFIAETKGSMSSLELRDIEKVKINCAKKYFEALNSKIDFNKVKYEFVDSFETLSSLIK